jgi:CheY-like chemotaxis protein
MRWSEPPGFDPHRDVSGALHDVSNVLTVLLGWVAQARGARLSADDLEHALAIIEDRARSARDLARRAIGANAGLEDRDEALDVIVRDVVGALTVEAARADVSVVVVAPTASALVPLAADATQILTNVIMNALAWAPAGSRVLVETETRARDVVVVVQDEGPGVSPSLAESVFAGASGREGGAGVGLRHARALARAAGGDLELLPDSSHPGARFRLRWPLVEANKPVSRSIVPPGPSLAGKRVLVVEDDAEVALLLETALGARGASVVVARTAAQLAESASLGHDAALIDLSPIQEDVAGAMDTLKRTSPNLVVVFISGSAFGLPDGYCVEGSRWVRKPFEIGEILAALSDASRL